MNDALPSPLVPFAWVTKRDGRLVPFDADKISRALFAATETLGRPDAFLARELTDVILHFLAADADGDTPTTDQIAEVVVKVVRELGHAALATTFATGAKHKRAVQATRPAALTERLEDWVANHSAPVPLMWQAGGACLREYALQHVFTRELVAAHDAGLITLTGLEAPFELAACVLDPRAVGCGPWAVGERLLEAIDEARHVAGVFLALDSPEYGLAHCPQTPVEYARDLHIGLRANGLAAVLNLNCATPPVWADELAEGPLFADYRQAPTPNHLAEIADTLLEELALRHRRYANGTGSPVRIDWHLGPRDFAPEGASRLARVARWLVEDTPITFVFDRPRRPVPLAEGIDRKQGALLLTVGVNLSDLVAMHVPTGDLEVFLQKLGSLVRLALSAAVQKREFLRARAVGRAALTRGFLLDRARLMLAPSGLEAVVRTLTGSGLGTPTGLDLARRLLQRLRGSLRQDGPACQLAAGLDGPAAFRLGTSGSPLTPVGLSAWDGTMVPEDQLRVSGALHAVAEAGTAALLLPEEELLAPEAIAAWLRLAWQRTEIVRLRLIRPTPPPAQRLASWAAASGTVENLPRP